MVIGYQWLGLFGCVSVGEITRHVRGAALLSLSHSVTGITSHSSGILLIRDEATTHKHNAASKTVLGYIDNSPGAVRLPKRTGSTCNADAQTLGTSDSFWLMEEWTQR